MGMFARMCVIMYWAEIVAPLLTKVNVREFIFTLGFFASPKYTLPMKSRRRNQVSKKAEIWEGSASVPG